MDRVTRYPILSIPHSSKVNDLPTDLESQYTFDIVQVESVSPGWDKNINEMDSGGQSFRFSPEETSGLRMVTITRETVPMPHLVKEKYVLTENYSANQWTPAWEPKSQLEVMKTGPTYTLRTYPEERHPGKLYSGEEGEEEQQMYRLGPGENVSPKRRKDFEREREAVIRDQVVKRSTTVATRWSSQEELDKIYSGQELSPPSASHSENVIDTEQINFLAARKQFMNLEKLTSNSQPPQKPMGRTIQNMRASPEVGKANDDQNTKSYWSSRVGLTNGYTVPIKTQGKDNAEGARPGSGALTLGYEEVSPELVLPHEGSKETPIEREIRRAQEREDDLRQQRGLQRSGSRDELVEVPARPLLSKVNLVVTPTPKKGKEPGRPSSLYIQRELALDTKREEDHRRQAELSKSTNHASRISTPSQLAKDSEVPEEAPKIRRVQSSDSILSLTSDTHPVKATLEGRKISRIPLEAYQPYLTPDSTKKEFSSYSSYKPPSSLGSGGHTMGSKRGESVVTPPLSSQKASWGGEQIREQPHKSQASTIQRQEPWRSPRQESTQKTWDVQEQGVGNASQGIIPRNYFHLQPMKVKVTSPASEEASVPQQQRVWEPKGHVEEVAIPPKPLRSQSSNLLEMEIQSVLQRERELEEERRNALFPEVFSPATELDQHFEWGDPDSRHSSTASGITGSYSVSETPTFSPVRFHSGLVWKVTDQTPRREDVPWKRRKDVGYAGLDTSDAVNTEIVEATKVTRHKNTMAARWEARIYASEDED